MKRTCSRPASPARRNRVPVGERGAHRPDAGHAEAEQDVLRLGERPSRSRVGWRRDRLVDQLPRVVDEQAVLDAPARRRRRVRQ